LRKKSSDKEKNMTKDWYLEDKTRLQGQPKRTIGDYVSSQGILVPRRFDTLAEARKSKKGIICRSEHPQEYDGVSGLLRSPRLSSRYPSFRGVKNLESVKEIYFNDLKSHGSSVFSQYCDLSGLREENFIAETSFSAWECLPGLNRMISADSAIEDRYHILSMNPQNATRNYIIFDKGNIEVLYDYEAGDDMKSIQRLIENYDRVRSLPKFNPEHCPIMEFQSSDKGDYFLQYHRGRDFNQATFQLDRNNSSGEIELRVVRGATPPEGESFEATIVPGRWYASKSGSLPKEEDCCEGGSESAYARLMMRKRKFQAFYSNNFDWTFNKLAAEHYARDALFKPKISGIVDLGKLYTEDENNEMIARARDTQEDQKIPMQVISDGRKAYIKRL